MKANLRFFYAACFLTLGLAQTHAASTNSFRVTVELQDGSRVVGKSGDEKFQFRSEILGELKLPLEQISSIECQPKTNSAKLKTVNGDTLAVVFAMKEIRIETSFGNIKIPVGSIRRLQVSAAGMSGRTKRGLVALWSGEGNADDSAGGCNGQLVNGVGFAPGKVGQAFDLNENFNGGFGPDGGNGFRFQGGRFNRGGGYVLIPVCPTLDVGKGDGFTIECWIKPTTVTVQQLITEYERVLGTADGADIGIDFVIQASSILDANIVDVNQTGHEISTPANLLVAGVWQHIALTYDKASGLAAFYINGIVVTQANLGSFTPQTSFGNLLLGARTTYGSASNPVGTFSGGLDEFGIYNRALSASEIQAICTEENNGQPLPPPTPRQMSFNGASQNFISE